MAKIRSLQPVGNQIKVILDDGTSVLCYPTSGGLWLARANEGTGPVDPPVDPEPTGDLTDWWTAELGISGDWEAHASYSRGGTDWAMPVGTPLKAVASGTIVNFGNVDGAGLKSMLVFDTPKVRKIAASGTLMNGVYVENGTANGVAFMMQHLSSQTPEGHYNMGDVVAISGNTGETTGPHLHAQILAGASVGADRMDFRKFV